MEVYMDNSATTRTFPEVAELMTKIMCEDYGNPSSLHMKGVEAEKYLRYAKETLARILKVEERELLFTSGGTESDNMALIGCALANCRRGNHLITTQIEHPAILQTMRYLETQGYRVTYLPVDPCGRIRLEDLRRAMTPETILVSIMHTNNEIGALQPIEEAGALIKQMNPDTLFHVDAVQGFGKSRIYPKKMHIDLLSVSGHKIHGPKGVGLLYVGERVKIQPIVFGGGQQQNLRSGTENVPGIAIFHRSNHGLSCIEDGTVGAAYDIGRYDLIGVVTEGLGRSSLHCCVDLFLGYSALNYCYQNGGRTGRGRNTLSGADQLAVQFGNYQADCLSCTGRVGNDVASACTASSQIALSLRSVKDHLVTGISVNSGHDTAHDRSAIVQSLSHRC